MNRSVLLILALCGGRDEVTIGQALSKASQIDLDQWDEENIPYTLRRKRQDFLNNKNPKNKKNS